MPHAPLSRRNFLQTLSAAGAVGAIGAPAAFASMHGGSESTRYEVLQAEPVTTPQHSIKFGVCGISHGHIYGMIEAITRGGGVLTRAWGLEPDLVAAFAKRYPHVVMAATQDEVLHDPAIQLVLSSQVANEPAND